MVFIALPALQRSQRDTQRKNDLSRTLTAVQSYQSNNRGQLPTDWGRLVNSYLKQCDGENIVAGDGSNRIAFAMFLEGGGVACENN